MVGYLTTLVEDVEIDSFRMNFPKKKPSFPKENPLCPKREFKFWYKEIIILIMLKLAPKIIKSPCQRDMTIHRGNQLYIEPIRSPLGRFFQIIFSDVCGQVQAFSVALSCGIASFFCGIFLVVMRAFSVALSCGYVSLLYLWLYELFLWLCKLLSCDIWGHTDSYNLSYEAISVWVSVEDICHHKSECWLIRACNLVIFLSIDWVT